MYKTSFLKLADDSWLWNNLLSLKLDVILHADTYNTRYNVCQV